MELSRALKRPKQHWQNSHAMDTREKKRGRPRATWRRIVEEEATSMQHSLGTIQRLAANREGSREFVAPLQDATGHTARWLLNQSPTKKMDGRDARRHTGFFLVKIFDARLHS